MHATHPPKDAEPALFALRYRAVSARDRRLDGQLVTAVTSTGIYCRPSCPARTPRPENVTFFLTSAAAQVPTSHAHRLLAERARGWAPWRSYAVMHLWRVAARRDAAPPRRLPGVSGRAGTEGQDGSAGRSGAGACGRVLRRGGT